MYFSIYNILPIAYVAIAVVSLTMLWLLIYYRRRIARLSAAAEADTHTDDTDGQLPPVSVIVYASYNAAELEETLPGILTQEYPGEFEVIVVNDGSCSELSDVVKRYSHDYPNLYQTFVPEKAHNLSRKKLATIARHQGRPHRLRGAYRSLRASRLPPLAAAYGPAFRLGQGGGDRLGAYRRPEVGNESI